MAKSQTKKCSRCGKVKPTSEYHKDKRKKDGLKIVCKNCCNFCAATGASLKAQSQTKKCSRCGEVKPISEYYKNKKVGLTSECKLCHKIDAAKGTSYKDRSQNSDLAVLNIPERLELDIITWTQADSMLREICEIELGLRAETANRNKRILQIKDECDRTLCVLKKRRREFFAAIERFALCEQQYIGMKLKVLRFGTVRVWNGECEVELDLFNAIQSKDKP